jgi:hypothetical protein
VHLVGIAPPLVDDVLVAPPVQIEKGAHFRPQHVRIEGLGEVVHGAELVPERRPPAVRVERGDEDDRQMLRRSARTDEPRALEPIGSRHHHVEQDHGDGSVLVEEVPERLLGAAGSEQADARLLDEGRER